MLSLAIGTPDKPIRRVLAIGCHADDIEIGCGATLLELTRTMPGLHVTWVVLAAAGARADEALASAHVFLAAVPDPDIRILPFRESFLPHDGAAVKEAFEALKGVEPDLVLTHARYDLHQDHRLASELTWNTFRDHAILEYEIPKYDGDIGAPNVFVPVTRELADEKIRLVLEHFPSQADRHWFDGELFRGLMRMRGMECAGQYAEAFTGRKIVLRAP
jgi:LmbE family N-acetylglucosaminyl deacetylase